MSLYSIVEKVNSKLKYYSEDSQLAFTTNSVGVSVASEFSEVLISYRETASDEQMIQDLKNEVIRRIDILQETMEALNEY